MIKKVLEIIHSDDVQDFLNKSIEVLYDKNFPFLSYIGVSYNDSSLINVKLYVTGFKKVSPELLTTFFPPFDYVREAYDKYEESKVFDLKNFGMAFILKVSNDFITTYSFYTRQRDIPHQPPQKIILKYPEVHLDDYFAFEMKPQQSPYMKRYYPIANRVNIEDFIKLFNMNRIDAEKVDCIEYLEYADEQKITLSMNDEKYLHSYIRKTNESNFIELNEFLMNTFEIKPVAIGQYLNRDEKSIYYMNTSDKLQLGNSTHTLQKFILNF